MLPEYYELFTKRSFYIVRFIGLIMLYSNAIPKKEEYNMKNIRVYRSKHTPAYPNEAAPGYFTQKLLDGITSAVTGMGILAIFFFLMTM